MISAHSVLLVFSSYKGFVSRWTSFEQQLACTEVSALRAGCHVWLRRRVGARRKRKPRRRRHCCSVDLGTSRMCFCQTSAPSRLLPGLLPLFRTNLMFSPSCKPPMESSADASAALGAGQKGALRRPSVADGALARGLQDGSFHKLGVLIAKRPNESPFLEPYMSPGQCISLHRRVGQGREPWT